MEQGGVGGIKQPAVTCADPPCLEELSVGLADAFHLLLIILGGLIFIVTNTCILFCLENLDAEQVKMLLPPLWQQKDS